jgi:NAD(P)-dependent dehydrogenase (short-subunit alcohol dehydrogenase family)
MSNPSPRFDPESFVRDEYSIAERKDLEGWKARRGQAAASKDQIRGRVLRMELKDKVVVITGGTGGIGQAMARAFLTEGARTVVISDLDADLVARVAAEIGCEGRACDVTDEAQVAALVEATLDAHGPIDLFCSNAGSIAEGVLTDAPNELWQQQWELHVMAHLYAARAVLPSMIARGEGYLLNTASAAGLLAAIGSGPYTVSKAAAVKLAEFLAITHGDDGIGVSVLCPRGVNTAMAPQSVADGASDGIIEADEVATDVVDALREERFHVLPHAEVGEYIKRKADDPDRWLKGMRRLRARGMQ